MTLNEKYLFGQQKFQEGVKFGFQMANSMQPAISPITPIPQMNLFSLPQIPHVSQTPKTPHVSQIPKTPHTQILQIPQIPQIPASANTSSDMPPPLNDVTNILVNTTKAGKSIKAKAKPIKTGLPPPTKEPDSFLDLSKRAVYSLSYYNINTMEMEHAMYFSFKNVSTNKRDLAKVMDKRVIKKAKQIWKCIGQNGFFDKRGKSGNRWRVNKDIYADDNGRLKHLNQLHFVYPVDITVGKCYENVRKKINTEIFEEERRIYKSLQAKGNKATETKGNEEKEKGKDRIEKMDMDGKGVVKNIVCDSEDIDNDSKEIVNSKNVILDIDDDIVNKGSEIGQCDNEIEPPLKKRKLGLNQVEHTYDAKENTNTVDSAQNKSTP
eukprot:399399_1